MPITPGQTLDNRYHIRSLLGQGGFGAVYLAEDDSLPGRLVAIKENLDRSQAAQDQFKREATILARLKHPNLPQVTDHFLLPSGEQYLVMEHVEGEDLDQILARRGPLPEAEVLGWMEQVMDALEYMHTWVDPAKGQLTPVVHRDIKPGNIKRTPQGRIMLMDFGIAKLMQVGGTLTGARAASPGFSPLEQYSGGTDVRSDIYSLGATIYCLLSGQMPPEAPELASGQASLPPLRAAAPGLSAVVEAAILRAMQLPVSGRFRSVAEMRQALQPGAWQACPRCGAMNRTGARFCHTCGSPLTSQLAPTPPVATPARPRLWMALAAAVLLVTTGALAAQMWPRPTAIFPTPAVVAATSIAPVAAMPGLTATPSTEPSPDPTATPGATATATNTVSPTPTATATATPTATPTPGIGSVLISATDGMEMVYVPAGDFLMGSLDGERGDGDERPQRTVYLDAFWIDKTEVTNAMFEGFVQATGHTSTAEQEGGGWTWTDDGWAYVAGADWRHPQGPADGLDGLATHPVVQVSWEDANAYCAWTGRRLPTEAEWEKAARGTDGRIYPWGDAWDVQSTQRLNFADKNLDADWSDKNADDGYAHTAPVGSYSGGASPYGALDMAGNVWEWVSDWYQGDYYASAPSRNPTGPGSGQYRVLRGGSWINIDYFVRSAVRNYNTPDYRFFSVGFRCARSP